MLKWSGATIEHYGRSTRLPTKSTDLYSILRINVKITWCSSSPLRWCSQSEQGHLLLRSKLRFNSQHPDLMMAIGWRGGGGAKMCAVIRSSTSPAWHFNVCGPNPSLHLNKKRALTQSARHNPIMINGNAPSMAATSPRCGFNPS